MSPPLASWGATPAEVAGPVVGDELVADAALTATRSIDLAAEPAEVFPWLRQMGFGRGGWYSYDWIDNLGRQSACRIHPEWQEVEQGDLVPGGPIAFEAAIVEPPRALVLRLPPAGEPGRVAFSLAYELRSSHRGTTRLVTRVRAALRVPLGPVIARWVLGPGDGIMVRRQLLSLRERVDRSNHRIGPA